MIKLLDLLKEIKSKPKAIFMAGPAGSGKTFVSAHIIPKNLTVINVDDTYEELLKAAGLCVFQKSAKRKIILQTSKLYLAFPYSSIQVISCPFKKLSTAVCT